MSLRSIVAWVSVALSSCLTAGFASAAEDAAYTHQIFFRGAYSAMTASRGTEIFTDTLGTTVTNSSKGGFSIAAGLDLSTMRMEDMGGANLMGEVFAEFSRFSSNVVTNPASRLVGTPVPASQRQVNVTELNVTIAPKARFDGLGNGRIRPYIVPIGLAFLVNSPPSNTTSYLDIGLHFGGGVDVLVVDRISVGADIRYTHGFDQSNTNTKYWSTGIYAALNF